MGPRNVIFFAIMYVSIFCFGLPARSDELGDAMLDNWVVTGIVSCPRCDPAQGATSVTYVLSKEGVHHRSKKECEDTLPLFDQFRKSVQDQGMTTELKCVNSPEPDSPAR
jgi:hypothetical protein